MGPSQTDLECPKSMFLKMGSMILNLVWYSWNVLFDNDAKVNIKKYAYTQRNIGDHKLQPSIQV